MAADFYRILEVLSVAILILSLLRCLFSHNQGVVYVNTYGKLKYPSDVPILIEVYYEALDGNSKEFIIQQLIPTYDKLENITEVMLLPYGKTHMFQNSNGSYQIRCLPKPEQCEANLQHACINEIINDMHVSLQVIKCLMEKYEDAEASISLRKCCQVYQVTVTDAIQDCVNGSQGMELLKRNSEMTAEATKDLFQEPFVVVTGLGKVAEKFVENIFENICKLGHRNSKLTLDKYCEDN